MGHKINTDGQYTAFQLNTIMVTKAVDILDVNCRIRALMQEHGFSEYKMAQVAGLSQSTVKNIFRRNTVPTISTLEAICEAFGISLAQFFAENNLVELSPEQQQLFKKWVTLTGEQKELLYSLIQQMK